MATTAKTIDWRVRVYLANDSTIDFTLTVTDLHKAPGRIGSQNVNVLEGRASGSEWTVDVLDRITSGTSFTSRLSDGSGNADKMMKLIDLQRNLDGAGFVTIATGRITAIHLTNKPLVFTISVGDERVLERRTQVFTAANTSILFPGGVRQDYDNPTNGRGFPMVHRVPPLWTIVSKSGQLVEVDATIQDEDQIFEPGLAEIIIEDEKSDVINGEGNFKFLRFRSLTGVNNENPQQPPTGGTDHEIVGWYDEAVEPSVLAAGSKNLGGQNFLHAQIKWSGTTPTVGTEVRAYWHMPGRPPDNALPLHIGRSGIGGITDFHSVDMIQLIKDIYDGDFQGDNGTTIRYDSNVFSKYDVSTNPTGLIDNPHIERASNRMRVTEPKNLYEFTEDVYAALGLVGWVNELNEIAPRRLFLPDEDAVPDVNTLPVIDDSKLRGVPTWRQTQAQRVTVVEFEHSIVAGPGLLFPFNPHFELIEDGPVVVSPFFGPFPTGRIPGAGFSFLENPPGFDGLATGPVTTFEREADGIATKGRFVITRRVEFIQHKLSLERYADNHAPQVFQRWQDGAISTEVDVTESLSAVEKGDFVILSSATYPNVEIDARGGDRLIQVINRGVDILGLHLWLSDVGEKLQGLSAPSMGIIKNVAEPKTHVDVTVTVVAIGDGYELQLAVNPTSPADNSGLWASAFTKEVTTVAANVQTFGPLPTGKIVWARARATRPGRISSRYATPVSVTLDTISAPTSLVVSNITGSTADLSWTNADNVFNVQVLLDGGAVNRGFLAPGSTKFTLRGLSLSTLYNAPGAGVRHVDPRTGGFSAAVTASFTTTATLPTLPAPIVAILKGDSVGVRIGFPV